MNEFFIYLEDITLSPGYLKGWRTFKVLINFINKFKAISKTCHQDHVKSFISQDKITGASGLCLIEFHLQIDLLSSCKSCQMCE